MIKNMKIYHLTCVICGKDFTNVNPQSKTCDEECRKMLNREKKKEYTLKYKRNKKPNSLLVEMSIRAKELGLSYGQYVALKDEGLVE